MWRHVDWCKSANLYGVISHETATFKINLYFDRTSNEVVSVAPSRGSSKTRPKRPPNNSNSGIGSGRQSSQGGHRKRRPSSRRQNDKPARSSTASTTSTTPAYNYPHTTPEPPTTPDPGSGKITHRFWLSHSQRSAQLHSLTCTHLSINRYFIQRIK